MMQWSEQQQAIFLWHKAPPLDGNLVVRARAGTGKTTTIIEAVNFISAATGDHATSILVCAFNKRIQMELQRKLGGAAECLTLHALGYKFLRGAWGNLTVDNDVEDTRVEKACQWKTPGDAMPPWDVVAGIKKLIGIAKGVAPEGTPSDLTELCVAFACDTDSDSYDARWVAEVAWYAMNLARTPDPMGRITFDDMLFIPAVEHYTVPLYDWVIVDEAQDMNRTQLMLATAARKPGGHIVVVGDDRQAIYGFRGADSNAIDRLKEELKADELGLNTTYRCGKAIVAKAQEIVEDFFHAPDAHDGVVSEISVDELLDAVHPGDVILSRVNAPLVPLCLSLIRKQIGARIEGRDIGKLLSARAKKLKATNVDDFLAKLSRWANTAISRVVARGKAVDSRLQQIRDVEATLEALTEDAKSVQDIYTRCERLFADAAESGSAQLVILSSVHKAKGLEWNRVFLLEETLYVFGQKMEDREEANIAYVAITRAKSELTLVKGHHAAG